MSPSRRLLIALTNNALAGALVGLLPFIATH